ncbi:translation initiation factor [Gossypium australe]|uniref:Translation initiation factor n=1 Tax=Gossypium australe TaxID=47621 RepID=A0A5B6VGZ5_9ROSI|nr:translation initiation factor [Gossypium australe]
MSSASLSSALPPTASASAGSRRNPHLRIPKTLFTFHHPHHHHHPFLLRVTNETSRTEVSTTDPTNERLESDKIVDGMDFGELCNEFECISSPLVESTARQLVRDILELREGNRALGTYAVSVKYKDPVRSFTGREKYKRPLWITGALENPTVRVQEMVMLSTSVLNIKWTIQGKPKSFVAGIGGDLIIRVNSQFTLNQISGQVIEHEELWDLSSSSIIAQAFFWTSRRLFATVEAAKDLADGAKDLSTRFSTKQENTEIYPDPSGDPTKFFQRDDGFQRDVYQIALFLAVLYFVVQFLRTTL